MQIIWHGQSCFELISAQGKGSQVVLVVDPFDEETGLRLPKLEADVVLVTHDHHDHNNVKAVQPVPGSQSEPILIDGPGEYDIKGVFVRGIPSWHDQANGKEKGANTIFVIETEDLKICHLGDLGQKELTTDQVEQIGEVDVLLMPVGGVYTISSKEAVKIMAQIEPAITIPMHYQLPKLKMKLDGLDQFLKTVGLKKIEPLNKLSVKKKDILPEEAKIMVLNP